MNMKYMPWISLLLVNNKYRMLMDVKSELDPGPKLIGNASRHPANYDDQNIVLPR